MLKNKTDLRIKKKMKEHILVTKKSKNHHMRVNTKSQLQPMKKVKSLNIWLNLNKNSQESREKKNKNPIDTNKKHKIKESTKSQKDNITKSLN